MQIADVKISIMLNWLSFKDLMMYEISNKNKENKEIYSMDYFIFTGELKVTYQNLEKLSELGFKSKHLNLEYWNVKNYIVTFSNSIEKLTFSDRSFTNNDYLRIMSECPQITHLDFSNISNLSDIVLSKIADLYPNLKYLDINDNFNITSKSISNLTQHCHKLTCLNIKNQSLCEITIKNIFENCSLLTELNLSRALKIINPSSELDTLPFLTKLNISRFTTISHANISYITKACPFLIHLDISKNPLLSNNSLIEVSKNCKFLKYLNISICLNIVDSTILILCENCPHIVDLNLSGCRITDLSVLAVMNLKNIKVLNISGCKLLTKSSFQQSNNVKIYLV